MVVVVGAILQAPKKSYMQEKKRLDWQVEREVCLLTYGELFICLVV